MSGPNPKQVADQLAAADKAAKAAPGAAKSVAAVEPCPYPGLVIDGTPEFRKETLAALKQIEATPSGKKLLDDLKGSGKTITIKESKGGNECKGFTKAGLVKADGKPGAGSDSTVLFNPKKKSLGGSEPWQTRPPAIGLGHELVHAAHIAKGTGNLAEVDNDSQPDPSDPKKIAKEKTEEVRTVGVEPFDSEPYSENTLRDEWTPKQPQRPWY